MAGMRSARRRKRRTVSFLMGCGALFAIWLYGLVTFAGTIPTTVAHPDQSTEAIIVLTGGSGRLETGLGLLQSGTAETLFVSGVYQGIDVNNLIAMVQEDSNDLADRVEIGNATNTRGNAEESAAWVKKRNVQSLRLVTAAYHMPRSLLEFSHAMTEMEIIAHPVFPDHVKADWWLWPGTAGLVVKEYNKYLMVWIRLSFERLIAGARIPFMSEEGGIDN